MTANTVTLTEWSVTLRMGPSTWSTVTVPATDHATAIGAAHRLLGDHPVTNVE